MTLLLYDTRTSLVSIVARVRCRAMIKLIWAAAPGESTLRMSPEKALFLPTRRICRTSSAAVMVPPALHSTAHLMSAHQMPRSTAAARKAHAQ